MIAADRPARPAADARLLYVDRCGRFEHSRRSEFADFVRAGDVIVANDAATLPASLRAIHLASGEPIEVRLAGRDSLDSLDVQAFVAVLFGAGDFRTRTEDRPLPPPVRSGDRLQIGALHGVVEALLDHPRLVRLRFEAEPQRVWQTLALLGQPIQYAHVPAPLNLWDVWTPIAALPVAYEPPSAGFLLDWRTLAALRAKNATFVTLTHAAGISSTGDVELDRRLPLDEPYVIPAATARAVERARITDRRVIAIGTTVVRALEHAAALHGEVRAGAGLATQRIGARTRLRVVDAIVSGTHEIGSSHYELLRAFVDDESLQRIATALEGVGYLTHEFGDSVLIEADRRDALRTTAGDMPMPAIVARKVRCCGACLR